MSLIIVAVGYWLFADTYRHYTRKSDVLRVSCWGNYQNFQIWDQVRQAFQEVHGDVRIVIEYTPDYNQYKQRIQANAVAKNLPDVMQMDDDFFPEFASKFKFEAMDSWFKNDPEVSPDDYNDHALELFNVAGRQMGTPLWGFTVLIAANRASFRRAGVGLPDDETWTLDEFYDICRRVTSGPAGFAWKDRRVKQFAFFMPSWNYYAPILWAEGVRFLDDRRRHWRFYGPDTEQALTNYQDMVYKYRVAPTTLDALPASDVSFYTGRVAMSFVGAPVLPYLRSTSIDYVFLHPPRNAEGRRFTRETWDGLAMASSSGRKKQAWEFIKFMTGPAGSEIFLKLKANIPAWKKAQPKFGRDDRAHRSDKFVASLRYARPTPITVNFVPMSRAIIEAFDRMMRTDDPDPGNWANPTRRLTPQETIDLLLSKHGRIVKMFPPEDASKITDVPVQGAIKP